jgi:exonuclease III
LATRYEAEPGHTGVALIWNARIPGVGPWLSPTGRLAGITLNGPVGQGVRILFVYGPASPASCPKTVARLHRDLLNEFSRARRKNVPVIVMGDFNVVPEI